MALIPQALYLVQLQRLFAALNARGISNSEIRQELDAFELAIIGGDTTGDKFISSVQQQHLTVHTVNFFGEQLVMTHNASEDNIHFAYVAAVPRGVMVESPQSGPPIA